MSTIAHAAKRRFSIATTRTKTVEKNISNEYTSEKHELLRHKATLESALNFVKKGHTGWKDVADSYKKFAELIDGDTPVDAPMHQKAVEARDSANAVHDHMSAPLSSEAAPAVLVSHVRAYISELETIEKQFPDVEGKFVEFCRYEKKSGKLSDKAAKATDTTSGDKNVSRANRNVRKLEETRAAFQTKLDGVLDMLKRSNAKYVKVLECAYTAYWLYEDTFITATESRTKGLRSKCESCKDELVKFDVSKPAHGSIPPKTV